MFPSYDRPDTIEKALDILARRPCTLIAGGTDVYPALATAQAWGKEPYQHILDITALADLDRIVETEAAFRIGCLVTWTQVLESDLPAWFAALRLAAREVGGAQIQNRGTVVGNVCNASPAADGVPALLVLAAEVELVSHTGRRQLPLSGFIAGNRRTECRADEIVTAIVIPKCTAGARSSFLKLGARKYLVISIVMAAGAIELDAAGAVAAARIAVGSCSEVAQRLPALERELVGRSGRDRLEDVPAAVHFAALSPIDDLRASAAYRRGAALIVVRRLLARLRPGA